MHLVILKASIREELIIDEVHKLYISRVYLLDA